MAEQRQDGQGADRCQLERTLVERLAGPREDPGPWKLPTAFSAEHDIIVVIGDGGDTPVEVVDSVVAAAITRGLLRSARRGGPSGVVACVARCCVEGGIGCYLIDDASDPAADALRDATGCVVVSAAALNSVEALADLLDDVDVPYVALGQVGGTRLAMYSAVEGKALVDLGLDEL